MGIIDKNLEIASATALSTAATGLALVGNVIDLSTVSRDIGLGKPLFLAVRVSTAVTSGGAATVQFIAASDAQAAIAVDGTATSNALSPAIAKATLVAGYTTYIPLIPSAHERYLGLLQNVGTAALTAGAIDCWITDDVQKWTALPDGL